MGSPLTNPANDFFYTAANSTIYDWYGATIDELFNVDWNEIEETEYVGNPCPDGWRIPTCHELEGLNVNRSSWTTKDSQNGLYFRGMSSTLPDASSLFLPASGYRDYDNGAGKYRGHSGSYWSSKSAYHLGFASSDAYIGNTFRAYGSSVRCVHE